MKAYQCETCKFETITTPAFCPKCGGRQIKEFEAPDEGEVFSYTTIHVPPIEWQDKAPYHVALVQLTDRLKVTVHLEHKVEIGDKVKLREIKEQAYIFERV